MVLNTKQLIKKRNNDISGKNILSRLTRPFCPWMKKLPEGITTTALFLYFPVE